MHSEMFYLDMVKCIPDSVFADAAYRSLTRAGHLGRVGYRAVLQGSRATKVVEAKAR